MPASQFALRSAHTLKYNPNASHFGKYTELQFTERGRTRPSRSLPRHVDTSATPLACAAWHDDNLLACKRGMGSSSPYVATPGSPRLQTREGYFSILVLSPAMSSRMPPTPLTRRFPRPPLASKREMGVFFPFYDDTQPLSPANASGVVVFLVFSSATPSSPPVWTPTPPLPQTRPDESLPPFCHVVYN
jgi:hypothetical protein